MPNDASDMLVNALMEHIREQARKRMGPLPIDPLRGMDEAPVPPPPPQIPTQPWTPRFSLDGVTVPLPANHGANFEAYGNWKINPMNPTDIKFGGAGLRYRYDF